jgi:hypothetical protein
MLKELHNGISTLCNTMNLGEMRTNLIAKMEPYRAQMEAITMRSIVASAAYSANIIIIFPFFSALPVPAHPVDPNAAITSC